MGPGDLSHVPVSHALLAQLFLLLLLISLLLLPGAPSPEARTWNESLTQALWVCIARQVFPQHKNIGTEWQPGLGYPRQDTQVTGLPPATRALSSQVTRSVTS